ncbi:MAG: glycosyltransferase family 4 protein [Methylotenera sp.]|nr:glycosyltransferase family 4 protein [Oligoflexia bacterium]
MVTQFLGIGGLERMILNLCRTLRIGTAWTPEVVVFDHPSNSSAEQNLIGIFEKSEIPVHVHSKPPRFSWETVFQISRLIRERQIDALHTHDLGALIYGVMGRWFAFSWLRGRKVRLIHTQHSFVHMSRSWKYQLYERFFTHFVDQLSVVSQDLKETYLSLGLRPQKIHIIGNGVSFGARNDVRKRLQVRRELVEFAFAGQNDVQAAVQEKLLNHESDHWLLYLARIHAGKGQDHAVAVWNALSPAIRTRSTLIFVGPETDPGQLKRLEKQIQSAADPQRILLAGPTHHPERWLQAADLYLSCSEFEGMPLGPIEAAGTGLPLLLSRIPGHELLRDHSTQFDLKLPAEGAHCIEQILGAASVDAAEDSVQPRSFHEGLLASSRTIRSQYSLEFMAASYQALYEHSPS